MQRARRWFCTYLVARNTFYKKKKYTLYEETHEDKNIARMLIEFTFGSVYLLMAWPRNRGSGYSSSRYKKHSRLGKQKLLRAWKLDGTKLKMAVNYWIWTFCQMTLLLIICWVLEVRPCCQVFAGEDLLELNLVSAMSKPTVQYFLLHYQHMRNFVFTVRCHVLVCRHGVF